jgi:ribosomal 50S subunit-associated protein YjgA (DUF615 family)
LEVDVATTIEYLKSLFAAPSAETLALRELEESRRELLKSQAHQEYTAKMVEYHQGKITRLTKFLKTAMKEQDKEITS